MIVAFPSRAAVRAELDRDTVQDGETVTLSIERDAGQSAQPDVFPLRKDFEILGTSTSSETNIINGSVSRSNRWLVQLQPRHAGTLEIPPLAVGGDRTQALELHVVPVSPRAADRVAGHAFIEVEGPDPGRAIYVQQQVPYTVRLYYDDAVQNGELAAPDPANAIVEQLGQEKHYSATRRGREFHVVERRYVISPEKSGALQIAGVGFRGIAIAPEEHQEASSLGDEAMDRFMRNSPFASDPFFRNGLHMGTFFGDAGLPVAARGPEIALDVHPRPAAARGNWLPAEQLTLTDSWQDNPPQLRAGEPAMRTITIRAKGLAASQIPALDFGQPPNAHLYPEAGSNDTQTDGNSIYGISKQSVSYIPDAQGTLSIPPVELAWWNVRSNAQELATLPGRQLAIAPGVPGTQPSTPPAAPVAASARRPLPAPASEEPLTNRRMWLDGGLAFLLVAAASVLVLLVSRRRETRKARETREPRDARASGEPAPRRKAALRSLQQACSANDRNAAARALMDLASAEWPGRRPRGLRELAGRLDAGQAEILTLDRSLYGAEGLPWEGKALWDAMRGGFRPRHEMHHDDDGLQALYP
ncbi:MAG: BatD family protein [Usitatibacter sp.]